MPNTLWIDTNLNSQVATAGQAVVSLTGNVATQAARLVGLTLLRTIIGLNVAHLIHDSGEGSQRVFLGIGCGSQEAVAASAVPDPSVEQDYPPRGWVWKTAGRTYGFAADQAAVFDWRIDRDIRARRKLDNGDCYLIVENIADQGTNGIIVVMGLIRQLWMLT